MVRSFNRPSTAISSKTRLRERTTCGTTVARVTGDYVSARYIGPIYLTAIKTRGQTKWLPGGGSGRGSTHPAGGDRGLTSPSPALLRDLAGAWVGAASLQWRGRARDHRLYARQTGGHCRVPQRRADQARHL